MLVSAEMRYDSKQPLSHDKLHGREKDEQKAPNLRGVEWYHGDGVHEYTLRYTQEKYEDSSCWLAFVTKLKDGINSQASRMPQDTD